MLRVEAPSRLHLGQLDLNGSLGRMYGGIAVALESPRIVILAEEHDELIVRGFDSKRVRAIAGDFLLKAGIGRGARLEVEEAIPVHVGLGSSVQLRLAVGTALARLYNMDFTIEDIARITLQGFRTDACLGLFKYGGLTVASGIPKEFDMPDAEFYIPPVIFQHPFPDDWHFIVVTPETATEFRARREHISLDVLPPIPPEDVGLICRLLAMQLLPALLEESIDSFGQALTEIQWTIGKQFVSVQGGLYSHPSAEGIIRQLLNSGATGAGQSSWGPTVYGIVEGEQAALNSDAVLHKYLEESGIRARVRCLRACNHGVLVQSRKGKTEEHG
jgi:beta-RFAP synthase